MAPEVPLELARVRDHELAPVRAVLTVFIMTGKRMNHAAIFRNLRISSHTRSRSRGSISSISSQKKRLRPLHRFGHQQRVIELNRNYLKCENLSFTNKKANTMSHRKMLPSGAAGQRLLSYLLGVQSDINPSHAISQLIGIEGK